MQDSGTPLLGILIQTQRDSPLLASSSKPWAELTLGLCRPQAPASGAQVATGGKHCSDYKPKPQTSCPIATDQLCDLWGVTPLRARFPLLANEGKDHVYGSPSSHRGDTSQDPSEHKGAKRTHSVKERAGLGLLRRQEMWQWPSVIVRMTIIIKNFSNKLLSTLQRAFSLSPGIHNLVREVELDDGDSRLAGEEREARAK